MTTEPAPTDDVAAHEEDWADNPNMSASQTLNKFYSLPPAPTDDVAQLVESMRAAADEVHYDTVELLALAADALERQAADLAAARAEAERLREGYQAGLHQEEDDGRCTCGAEWICARWAEPSPENYADVAEAAGRLEAERDALRRQVAAVRAWTEPRLEDWNAPRGSYAHGCFDSAWQVRAALDTEGGP